MKKLLLYSQNSLSLFIFAIWGYINFVTETFLFFIIIMSGIPLDEKTPLTTFNDGFIYITLYNLIVFIFFFILLKNEINNTNLLKDSKNIFKTTFVFLGLFLFIIEFFISLFISLTELLELTGM